MNLYRITLQGMNSSIAGNVAHGIPYVVADNPTEAYNKVRQYLNEKDYGFPSDRVLKSIELLASDDIYSGCTVQLFFVDKESPRGEGEMR